MAQMFGYSGGFVNPKSINVFTSQWLYGKIAYVYHNGAWVKCMAYPKALLSLTKGYPYLGGTAFPWKGYINYWYDIDLSQGYAYMQAADSSDAEIASLAPWIPGGFNTYRPDLTEFSTLKFRAMWTLPSSGTGNFSVSIDDYSVFRTTLSSNGYEERSIDVSGYTGTHEILFNVFAQETSGSGSQEWITDVWLE